MANAANRYESEWATPIKPLTDDAMWEVWHDEWSGYFEFICGPGKAQELLNGGMHTVNGKPTRLEVIAHWPKINGVHIRVHTPKESNFGDRKIP